MKCSARIRPFADTPIYECILNQEDGHDFHQGEIRDMAYPGSLTLLSWHETDRRNFRGDWIPCDVHVPWQGSCTLPRNHTGSHA